ncbi:unnamed protein product [Strongylus vulgaris]|uniref:Uncharacterized protein n=1 Tax=Strongylus vulgaris TaxID=40348 RepID=A0A3P7ICK9_STRVU|nr:unnamed protein product [Strongylus vulgaris]
MRHCLAASHFTVVDESLFYVGYWGRHLKSSQYRSLKPHQKVNHYPGAFHIGRKDRLWMHIEKQQRRLGENVYGIMPKTYLLPKDYEHMRNYLTASPSNHVIIKPVNFSFLFFFFATVTFTKYFCYLIFSFSIHLLNWAA